MNLKRLPLTIEAIDISSLGKQEAVGSVVVFRDGSPDKSSYRRFKIRRTGVIDDYAMIAEVIRRRYTRLIKEKTRLPDLIVVDGGKGHVMRAAAELRSLGISAAVVGIAKKNEEIWFPHKGCPLCIPGDKPGLHLIQRIRDEAHRFAHSYQLIRRRKRMEESRKPKITKQ